MDNPVEHALVVKALKSGLSNCVRWKDDRTIQIVRNYFSLSNLAYTTHGIRIALIEYVKNGGEVKQVLETREDHEDYDFYYKAIVPVEGSHRGMFVEFVLSDDDHDCPVVTLVNAHLQP